MKKNIKISDELIQAGEAVFSAMAYLDTVKPIVTEYQKAILERHQFTNRKEGEIRKTKISNNKEEIILNPNRTYLMSDEDFEIY